MKLLAYDTLNHRTREIKLIDFENGSILFADSREQDWTTCRIDQVDIIKPVGINDMLGAPLYDGDIFEEVDGTKWKIHYDHARLSWQAIPISNDRLSTQGLCEFVDEFDGKLRIDGVKKATP